MFRFYKLEYVILLVFSIILLMYLVKSFYSYKRRILEFFSEPILYQITRNYNINKVFIYLVLSSVSLIMISVGIMAPQFGKKSVEVKKKGVDIIVALDVSKSMLAQDIMPSRLERAKLELSNLLSMLKGDRFGVVLFAGQAFMQVPLTTDYDAAKLFLRDVGVDSVPVQGTNFGSAFQLAKEMFLNNQLNSGARVILILTDGEDHEGNYEQLVDELRSLNIRVYAIGIGTLTGEPVPENIESKRSYKKDRSGQVVVSRLNEGILKKITASTGGIYVQGNNNEIGIPLIADELRKLKKGEIATKEIYDFLDRYYILALISFLVLLYAFLILPFVGLKKREPIIMLGIFAFVLLSGFSPFLRENPENKEGNELYNKGSYKDAAEKYNKALKDLPLDSMIHYNRAAALIKDKKYSEAYDELRKAIVGADDKLKSKIYYNMGNLFIEQQKYDEAIDSYIKSIQHNKEFVDPKHNLEMVLRMMKEQKEKQKDNQEKKRQEEKKEEDKKKQANQEKKEEEKPEEQKENRDLARAEQLLDALKDKETEQPFSKFLIKEFKNTDVEKDW